MLDAFSSFPSALFSTFSLIGLAEMGDKSQLVCMTLAIRYRAWPVLSGAVAAFAILNLMAVLFGTAIAHWFPEQIVLLFVGLLFIVFGIFMFKHANESEEENIILETGSHNVFFTTFLLISIAEFGDKTQIAVAGLGSTSDPLAVWLGATLALAATSALGVWAGRTVLQRISISLIHKIGAAIFILLGLFALGSLLL